MAMPGKVKNLPDQNRPHVHFENSSHTEYDNNIIRNKTAPGAQDDVAMLKFPHTKNILWDHTSTGSAVHLSISYFRKPKLCVQEKVLRFAQRHIESTGQPECGCALVGTLATDDDGQGVTFTLDRFDPGGGLSTSTGALSIGDLAVPIDIIGNSKKDRQSSVEDYVKGLNVLRQRCCLKDPVDVGTFLLMKGWCNFYSNGEKNIHHLEFDIITMATEFKATPIAPVPIVPTALSKNLSGPMSLSHLQGEPKSGYLTMDHTRKVLLALDSDPKVFNLPLVGIWISGVPFVYSPYIWAACLRFLFNASINDRVCTPPEAFLLILYSPVHSKPEFYEVNSISGNNKMDFELLTGYEVISIPKAVTAGPRGFVDMDLNSVKSGQKKDAFDGALHTFFSERPSSSLEDSTSNLISSSDDITPRSKPAPYKSQLPTPMSMVPEVSLLFGEDGQSGIFADNGPKRLTINPGRPNGVNHLKDFQPQKTLTTLPEGQQMPVSSQYGGQNIAQNLGGMAHPQQPPPVYSGPTSRMPTHSQSAPVVSLQNNYHSAINTPQSNKGAFRNDYHENVSRGQNIQQYLGNTYNAPSCVNEQFSTPVRMPNYSVDMKHFNSQQMCQPSGGRVSQQHQVPSQNFPQNMASNYGAPMSAPVQSYPRLASQPSMVPSHFQYQDPQQAMRNGIPLSAGDLNGRYVMSGHPGYPQRMPMSAQAVGVQQQMQNGQQPYQTRPQQMIPPHEQKTGSMQDPRFVQNIGYQQIRPAYPPQQIVNSPYPSQPYNNQSSANQPVSTTSTNQYGNSAPMLTKCPQDGDYTTPLHNRHQNEAAVCNNNSRGSSGTQGDSSKSSDDSGLSFTPEKGAGPNKNTSSTPTSQTALQKDLMPSAINSDINWDMVPKEVYHLLLQQDAQLKQLQSQIQMLMQNQSASTQQTTMTDLPSSLNSSDRGLKDSAVGCELTQQKDMCSVGINTTMMYQQGPDVHVTNGTQTSPRKMVPSRSSHQLHESSSSGSSNRSKAFSDPGLSNYSNDCRTPAEIRHRGVLQFNSTEREEQDVEMSKEDLSCVVQNMALHDRTVDSVQSDMIVDLPSYQSTNSRSTSKDTGSMDASSMSKSPLSASVCGNQGGEHSDGESEEDTEANSKEYYDRLMDNIHKLLNQQKEEGLTVENVTANAEFNDTLHQSVMLGQYLNNLQRVEGMGNQMDTTFIPKINYMSMMFDSDSDSSMEINAMAMKYLKDEQLTRLNKLHTHAAALKGTKDSQRLAMLKHVLSDDREATPDVTSTGISPNDMTFATRKYMERHGLLSDSSSVGDSSTDTLMGENYQLKVNYSSVTSGSSDQRFTQERLNSPYGQRNVQTTPTLRNISEQQSENPYGQKATDKLRNLVNGNYDTTNPSQPRTPLNNHTSSRVRSTPRNDHVNSPRFEKNQTPENPHHRSSSANVVVNAIPNGHQMFATPEPHRVFSRTGDMMTTPVQQIKRQHPLNEVENVCSPVQVRDHATQQRHVLSPPKPEAVNRAERSQQNHAFNVEDDDKILDITRLKLLPKLL